MRKLNFWGLINENSNEFSMNKDFLVIVTLEFVVESQRFVSGELIDLSRIL